jgi:hypothetical protein
VVAEAVQIVPVSVAFSLLTGKRTGNFVKIDLARPVLQHFFSTASTACERIPYRIEQGIFSAEQGMVPRQQGSGANESEFAARREHAASLIASIADTSSLWMDGTFIRNEH